MPLPRLLFDRFLTYRPLTSFLRRLERSHPQLVHLSSIGKSREGREVWLLEITNRETGAAEEKPAYLVHANIHAQEVAGTHTACFIARELVRCFGEDEEITALLNETVFYIVPRLNPDGAEYAVVTGGGIRSRTEYRLERNALIPQDINGDGLILNMRWEDPTGDYVKAPEDTRVMLRRQEDSTGPFYRVMPEGLINEYDGGEVRLTQRGYDWNRNWAMNWLPEPKQWGAGDFPFSEPEMRALAEFIFAHPNIYGLLGLHTGCSSLLRPPSSGDESALKSADLQIMKEIGKKGEEITGLKMRPITQYKWDYSDPINLFGHFGDWGYHHLGLFVFEVELGTIYNAAGLTTEEVFALSREETERLELRCLQWHDANPQYQAFVDWKPFDHPQLGRVEIGGWRSTFHQNPSFKDLRNLCPKVTAFMLEHARRHPRLVLEQTAVDKVGDHVFRIRATVRNAGAFPTQITEKGNELSFVKPGEAVLTLDRNLELLSYSSRIELGHLPGVTGHRKLEWFVRLKPGRSGKATLTAHCPRAGKVVQKILVK